MKNALTRSPFPSRRIIGATVFAWNLIRFSRKPVPPGGRGMSFPTRIPLASVLVLSLVACSPIGVLNSASPSGHFERMANIRYGDLPRQVLDVYVPKSVAAPAPMVVFFYGGGWRDGSKDDYEFVASALTEAGHIVVIADYRLFPEVVFPTFVEDSALATAWALDNVARLGADPRRVFVMGHSAGAHIAALLALDPSYLATAGIAGQPFAGLIGLSGPYDFLPIESGYLLEVFPENLRARSQPVNFVSSDAPRTLLIHGNDDSTVLPANSRSLATALATAGIDVTSTFYDDVGHVRVVVALAPPLSFLSATLDDSIAFINETPASR